VLYQHLFSEKIFYSFSFLTLPAIAPISTRISFDLSPFYTYYSKLYPNLTKPSKEFLE
jgi:hypothetical protein